MAQTEKSSLKVIEDDFEGLNYTTSDLNKSTASFKICDNTISTETPGIQKRAGFELSSIAGLHLGTDTYIYLDRNTGETKEELLGFGAHVFKYKSCNLTITRTSGTFQIIVARSIYSPASTTITFFNGTTNDLVFTVSQAFNGTYTIGALCQALIATGLYTISLSEPGGVFTATMTAAANTATTASFASGYGLTIANSTGRAFTSYNRATGFLEYANFQRMPSSTSVQIIRKCPVTWNSGDSFGSCTGYIFSNNYQGSSSAASSQVLPFYFWDGIASGCLAPVSDTDSATIAGNPCFGGIFEDSLYYGLSLLTRKIPIIKGVNANDKYYFSMPYATNYSLTTGIATPYDSEVNPLGQLYCYDRAATYRAGVYRPASYAASTYSVYTAPTISTSSTTGNWRYAISLIYRDGNGVEWESELSTRVRSSTGGGGAGTTVTYTPLLTNNLKELIYYDSRGGRLSAIASGVTTLSVRGVGATTYPNITVGDRLYFTYPTSGAGYVTVTGINFTGPTYTVTVDTAVTAASGAFFSTGLFIRIYRTKEYGTILYTVATLPAPKAGAISYVDTLADTALGVEYVEPLGGQEHEPPPVVGNLTTHQGSLVSAGSSLEPNTVFWSGADGIEYFPRAFNSTDVPSNVTGSLTALISDSDNSLALFKERAYYSLDGDLASASISVRSIKEGDYGISSQASIAKIDGTIVGVSKQGVVSVNNGVMDWRAVGKINPVLKNSSINYDFSRAVGINDYLTNQYILTVPYDETDSNLPVTSTEKHVTFAFHYENLKWCSKSFDYDSSDVSSVLLKADFSGGTAVWNSNYYSVSRAAIRTGATSVSTISFNNFRTSLLSGCLIQRKDRLSYVAPNHGGLPVSAVWNDFDLAPVRERIYTSFDSFGEPSLFKLIHRIYIWRLPSEYRLSNGAYYPVEFDALSLTRESLIVAAYADWNNVGVGVKKSSNEVVMVPDNMASTLPFAELNMRDQKARAIAVEILNSKYNENLYVSGIEIIYSTPFNSESKKGGVAFRA